MGISKVFGFKRGLLRNFNEELLDGALPPPLGELDFDKFAPGHTGDDGSPEVAGGGIGGHLTHLPKAGVGTEYMFGKGLAVTCASVAFEDEKLLHPIALPLGDFGGRDQCNTGIVLIHQEDVGKIVGGLFMLSGVVAKLPLRVEFLWPDIGELVLIEFQHPADRGEVLWQGQPAADGHGKGRR